MATPPEGIRIFGARENNLRGVSCFFPSRALTVVTGPPGSGKRSLVFATLAREAQRRFSILSMSEGAVDPGAMPQVDLIRGLSFVRTFRAKSYSRTTELFGDAVGIIEILTRLFREHGTIRCPRCGGAIERSGWEEVRREFELFPAEAEISLTVSLPAGSAKDADAAKAKLLREGLVWAIIDGERIHLEELHSSAVVENGKLEALVEIMTRGSGSLERLREALEVANRIGEGQAIPEISARFGSDVRSFAIVSGSRCSGCGAHFVDDEQLERQIGDRTLSAILAQNGRECLAWAKTIALSDTIVAQLRERLELLENLSLGGLPLSMRLPELNPFEGLRLQLAAHIAGGISGATLLLEEPSVDLRPDGVEKLLSVLQRRVSSGDTVVVVDTDPQLCRAADHLVVLGPDSGRRGGTLVIEGDTEAVAHAAPTVFETYDRNVQPPPAAGSEISGTELPEKSSKCVLEVLNVLPLLTDFYSRLPEAKIHGISASGFLNRSRGEGLFRDGRDEIRYNGVSLPELLTFEIREARDFFQKLIRIGKVFETACHAEIGYLRLGQSLNSLSYPERSRLELALALSRGKMKGDVVTLRFATGGLRAQEIRRFFAFLRETGQERSVAISARL